MTGSDFISVLDPGNTFQSTFPDTSLSLHLIYSLRDLTQSPGFNDHQQANDPNVSISSSFLFPELHTHIQLSSHYLHLES